MKTILKMSLLLVLLSFSTHTVMAQCNGEVLSTPGPSLACNCGGYLTDCVGGGLQLDSYPTCGNVVQGGTSCQTDNTGVIGEVITCTPTYNYWAIATCLTTEILCAIPCAGASTGVGVSACLSCLAPIEYSAEGPGNPVCKICDNIVTCTGSSIPYPGPYYSGTTGTCPTD